MKQNTVACSGCVHIEHVSTKQVKGDKKVLITGVHRDNKITISTTVKKGQSKLFNDLSKRLTTGNSICFDGFLNDRGQVLCEPHMVTMAYLSTPGIRVQGSNEIVTYTRDENEFHVHLKTPTYEMTYNSIEVLLYASSNTLINQIDGFLNKTREFNFKGVMQNNKFYVSNILA